jgi:hypothetical protein
LTSPPRRRGVSGAPPNAPRAALLAAPVAEVDRPRASLPCRVCCSGNAPSRSLAAIASPALPSNSRTRGISDLGGRAVPPCRPGRHDSSGFGGIRQEPKSDRCDRRRGGRGYDGVRASLLAVRGAGGDCPSALDEGAPGPRTRESARRGGSAGASYQRGGLRAARAPPAQPLCDDCTVFNCDQASFCDMIRTAT